MSFLKSACMAGVAAVMLAGTVPAMAQPYGYGFGGPGWHHRHHGPYGYGYGGPGWHHRWHHGWGPGYGYGYGRRFHHHGFYGGPRY